MSMANRTKTLDFIGRTWSHMSIATSHTPKGGQLPLPDFAFDFANFNYVSR